MSKRSRTLLFLAFVFIFIAAIPFIVLYTQGYRVDIGQRKIVKTGGIDIVAHPFDTRIFLDGEFKEGTNFFSRSTFLNNLLPGDYDVRVEKDGYHAWQKVVAVLEGQVTKFPLIQLFPNELNRSVIATNLTDVRTSPNSQFLLALRESAASAEKSASIDFVLLNMENGTQTPMYKLGMGESVVHAEWAPSSQTFYFVIRDALGEQFYTSSIAAPEQLFAWSGLLRNTYLQFERANHKFVVTQDPQILLIFTPFEDGALILDRLDADPGLLEEELRTDIRAFVVEDDNLFYLDTEQLLVRYNLASGASEILSDVLVSEPVLSSIQLFARQDGNALALAVNGALFVWEEGAPLAKIADNANGMHFGPDEETVLYYNDKQVSIYWFNEVFGPPKRIAGDIETIEFTDGIVAAHWYNNNAGYAIVEQPNGIVAVEVDSSGGRNATSYDLSNIEMLGYNRDLRLLFGLSGTTIVALSLDGQ